MNNYWARFEEIDGSIYRYDTRIYLIPTSSIKEDDVCLGAVVGKNPGSAQGEVNVDLKQIELNGDKLLPTVKNIFLKSYKQADMKPPKNAYIQVLNLFYLCEPNLNLAKKEIKEKTNKGICQTENKYFSFIWFVWGGDDKFLNEYKERFLSIKASMYFYYNDKQGIVENIPVNNILAKHTQGLSHNHIIPYISYLLQYLKKYSKDEILEINKNRMISVSLDELLENKVINNNFDDFEIIHNYIYEIQYTNRFDDFKKVITILKNNGINIHATDSEKGNMLQSILETNFMTDVDKKLDMFKIALYEFEIEPFEQFKYGNLSFNGYIIDQFTRDSLYELSNHMINFNLIQKLRMILFDYSLMYIKKYNITNIPPFKQHLLLMFQLPHYEEFKILYDLGLRFDTSFSQYYIYEDDTKPDMKHIFDYVEDITDGIYKKYYIKMEDDINSKLIPLINKAYITRKLKI